MFLKIFLAVLALGSVRAEELNCAELLETNEHPSLFLGKWILHAVGYDNMNVLNMLRKPDSSWIKITPTEAVGKRDVHMEEKVGMRCFHYDGDGHVYDRHVLQIFKLKNYDRVQLGTFLQTHDENTAVLVQVHHVYGNEHFQGNTISLFSKNGVVSDASLKHFQHQAACKNIVNIIYLNTNDLCPEVEAEPTK